MLLLRILSRVPSLPELTSPRLRMPPRWLQRLQSPRAQVDSEAPPAQCLFRLLHPRPLQTPTLLMLLQALSRLSPPRLLHRALGLMDSVLLVESLYVVTLPGLNRSIFLSDPRG
jgi:hypothetical protein